LQKVNQTTAAALMRVKWRAVQFELTGAGLIVSLNLAHLGTHYTGTGG